MREDLEQQEQLEALKGFWAENRRWIVGAIVASALGSAGYFGWQAWQSHRAEQSGLLYEALQQGVDAQNIEKAETAYGQLTKDFSGTIHSDLGSLRMAKVYVVAGKPDQAVAALKLAGASHDEALAWVAKTRLAAVLIDQEKLEEALAALVGTPPTSLEPMVSDRRGDVLLLLGRKEEARQAYTQARDRLQLEDAGRALEIVNRKLGALDALSDSIANAPKSQ